MSQQPAGAAIDELSVNTIRFLAVDGVQKANSGHPGLPMGMAPVAHVLFTRHLKFDPSDPGWPDRDRFVLSAGHGSMLLYALLHLSGYDLSLDDLRAFRQWGSRTPGHPEHGETPGVEATTGPLGQGLANAVGMAIAETFLGATFNRAGQALVDHHTYVLESDGGLMEGVASEAASLAGHLGLGKLIVLYDDNHIHIEGSTDLDFTEDVVQRFDAYGWHTQSVADANDLVAVDAALVAAKAAADRPSLIAVRSHIGYGSPNRQDTAKAHGEALGVDEVRLTKEALGWPLEPTFLVPDEVREFYARAGERGAAARAGWAQGAQAWRAAAPDLAQVWDRAWRREPAPGWEAALPVFAADPGGEATRSASGAVINAVASFLPTLIGGSADLAPSNNTFIKSVEAFQADCPGGRNLHFGVREHGMAGIANGLALHGGVLPYVATFFVFTDYMRPAMRLAALMGLPVLYVLTHDSIGLGEDGPTHQPVEHLAALRAMPNMTVIRPADANETVEAWKAALGHTGGPVCLVLTRQKLPTLDRGGFGAANGVARGGYVLDAGAGGDPDLILIATGSEVHIALAAAATLRAEGANVRVVNLASRELFDLQDAAYRESVLPAAVTARVAVEAAVSFGWGDIVGSAGAVVGLDRFGASAPAGELFARLGITAERVCERAREFLAT
jgi:transketolase